MIEPHAHCWVQGTCGILKVKSGCCTETRLREPNTRGNNAPQLPNRGWRQAQNWNCITHFAFASSVEELLAWPFVFGDGLDPLTSELRRFHLPQLLLKPRSLPDFWMVALPPARQIALAVFSATSGQVATTTVLGEMTRSALRSGERRKRGAPKASAQEIPGNAEPSHQCSSAAPPWDDRCASLQATGRA